MVQVGEPRRPPPALSLHSQLRSQQSSIFQRAGEGTKKEQSARMLIQVALQLQLWILKTGRRQTYWECLHVHVCL